MRTIHERQTPRTSDLNPALAFICPRYLSCNAGFCPAIGGTHVKGEVICLWLREAVKTAGRAKIGAACAGNLAEAVLVAAQRLLTQRCALADELRRAARHGSQIESGHRLRVAALAAGAER